MAVITANRCFNHPHREAAARCPSCGRHFCRECITEHQGRMICSTCLEKETADRAGGRSLLALPLKTLAAGAGVTVLWLLFLVLGKILLLLPSAFHEGRFWDLL